MNNFISGKNGIATVHGIQSAQIVRDGGEWTIVIDYQKSWGLGFNDDRSARIQFETREEADKAMTIIKQKNKLIEAEREVA